MRITLGKLIVAPVILAAAAAIATIPASAEARVTVPFDFSVNGQNLPAGQYVVERAGLDNRAVILSSEQGLRSFTWSLNPGDSQPDGKVIMTFDTQNQAHMLRTIAYGSMATSKLDKSGKHSEHLSIETVEGQ
jgi:hypothetical protein